MLFFDTSALAKRYWRESGTEVVDELIEESDRPVVLSTLSIIEIASALRRKQNAGGGYSDHPDRMTELEARRQYRTEASRERSIDPADVLKDAASSVGATCHVASRETARLRDGEGVRHR